MRWATDARKRWLGWTWVALVLALGLAVRLYDLTDWPLDFHPTRQYRGLLLARTLYLRWRPGAITPLEVAQRAAGFKVALYEPLLLEGLVAWTYLRLGGIFPWVVRVYNAVFWLLGAWGVALLARRWTGRWGAWVAVAYWMLLPFAVYASRAFQPDPLMTVLLVWMAYFAWRWAEGEGTRWLAAAALTGWLAGVVKLYALFFVGGVFLGAAILLRGRDWWREVRWWLALAAVALGVGVVYLGVRSPERGAFFFSYWVVRMARWWLTPWPYGGWLRQVVSNLGGGWVLAAMLGVLAASPRPRWLMGGWLLGYGLYGLFTPAQIATHSYYHLPLVPWVALGLALGVGKLAPWLHSLQGWRRWALVAVSLLGVMYPAGEVFWTLHEVDYRPWVQGLTEVAQHLSPEDGVVALTQAYGWPLLYHAGISVRLWPSEARQRWLEEANWRRLFRQQTQGVDWFLVTDWEEWARQGQLRAYLTRCYPIVVETPVYRLYDLRRPYPACAMP